MENIRAAGFVNGKPSILLILFRQPGANIIDTVDRVREALPSLKASIPSAIEMKVVMDRTTTIRASVTDVQRTLMISVALVIMVVFLFLRSPQATFIPSIVVPVSLIGTFGVMYLFGYTVDNLSLMALTISTGFVVDDAIVVIENVTRHLELGLSPMEAAMKGASEVGFTVLSISVSLIAVFIPILLMGGIVGRLFREFAVVLSVVHPGVAGDPADDDADDVLGDPPASQAGQIKSGFTKRASGRLSSGWAEHLYDRTLSFVLRHPAMTPMVLLVTISVNVVLMVVVPMGFFRSRTTD